MISSPLLFALSTFEIYLSHNCREFHLIWSNYLLLKTMYGFERDYSICIQIFIVIRKTQVIVIIIDDWGHLFLIFLLFWGWLCRDMIRFEHYFSLVLGLFYSFNFTIFWWEFENVQQYVFVFWLWFHVSEQLFMSSSFNKFFFSFLGNLSLLGFQLILLPIWFLNEYLDMFD
jgi:hypothetical protein